jgi:hypothetical protein
MAISFTASEAAITASVGTQVATIQSNAAAAFKIALDAFVAEFTVNPTTDYALVATFLADLGDAATDAEDTPSAEDIVACIPSDLTDQVTTAVEALVESALPGIGTTVPASEDHKEFFVEETP